MESFDPQKTSKGLRLLAQLGDYDEAEIGVGSTPRFFTLPRFLEFDGFDSNRWHSLMLSVTKRLEDRIHNFFAVSRPVLTFVLEGRGMFRPGHLGPRRDDFISHMDRLFGSPYWEFEHVINGHRFSVDRAFELFEKGYENYFKENPSQLEWLVKNYQDVYDTCPENTKSGLDYSKQETPDRGQHIHDIAIRRAIKTLGRTFEGDKLLHVRGHETEGHHLSPGVVPFNVRGINFYSFSNGWWESGSIEDFYQGTRHVFVRGFLKPHIPPEIWENDPKLAAERVAARFIHQMIPSIVSGEMTLEDASKLPWKLSPTSLPLDRFGRPRKFTPSEMKHLLESFLDMFEFVSESLNQDKRIAIRASLQTAKKTLNYLKPFIETGKFKPPSDKRAQAEYQELCAEFNNIENWSPYLNEFYRFLEQDDKQVPIVLARDGLSISEYIDYRALLKDVEGRRITVYMPGAPSTLGKKNGRGEDPTIKLLASTVEQIARDVSEDGYIGLDANREFQERISRKIHETADLKRYCDSLRTRILEGLPEGSLPVILDTFGSGKTTLLIDAILGVRGTKILLGQKNSHPFGEQLKNPFEIDSIINSSEDIYHDIRWPIEFNSQTTSGVKFNVNPSPTILLRTLYRAIRIYHQALDDHFPTPTQ